jgi:hypothetical protein
MTFFLPPHATEPKSATGELADNIDFDSTINRFASLKSRRKKFKLIATTAAL